MLNDAWVQSNLLCILKLYFSIINTTLYIFYIFLDTKTSEDFTDEVECIVPTMSKKLSHSQTGKINQRIYESYYAATDILTVRRVAIYINNDNLNDFAIVNAIQLIDTVLRHVIDQETRSASHCESIHATTHSGFDRVVQTRDL